MHTKTVPRRMASETKPLLKYSSDGYSSQGGRVRQVLRHIETAENTVKTLWAKAVRVVHMREVFAEFLATFALVVSDIP